ncbi:MAG TPA: GAF domain-containing protein [Candidatus Dormibacteraeota bacterium]|nr:GAF domain-containing protein [Candidatus Dormibacteraeota bacterium]
MGKGLTGARSEALAAFHEISARMVASLDLDETLTAIARAATNVLEADVGAIFLPDEDDPDRRLLPRGLFGARSPAWNDLHLNSDHGLNSQAMAGGRVARIDDYLSFAESDPTLNSRSVVIGEPIHSAMAVPVLRRTTPIGTIGVYRRAVAPFDEEDEYLLALLSQQAGIALDNAFAYAELEATRDRLATAIEIAADLSQSLDPNEVIRRVLVRAVEAGRAHRGVLLRVDDADTVVEDFHDVSGAQDLIGYRHPIASQPLMLEAVSSRKPSIGGRYDVTKVDATLISSLGDVRHTATIPLVLDGEVTAVMVLSRRDDSPFKPSDLAMFQVIGNQAVLALRNARLFAQAQAVTRAQSDFLNMAAHELRTPLSVIAGYVSMMEDGTLGNPPNDWKVPLETLRSKSAELDSLISELLIASRLEAGTIPFQGSSVELREAVFAAIERLEPRAALLGARLTHNFPEQPVKVLADPEQLGRILDNLLNNALSYSLGTARITVTVQDLPEPRVEIRDRGRGVPPDQRQKIFERFYRIDDPAVRHVPGTGLGLYISRQLATRMGATLTLERSAPGKGSTFALRLLPSTG